MKSSLKPLWDPNQGQLTNCSYDKKFISKSKSRFIEATPGSCAWSHQGARMPQADPDFRGENAEMWVNPFIHAPLQQFQREWGAEMENKATFLIHKGIFLLSRASSCGVVGRSRCLGWRS